MKKEGERREGIRVTGEVSSKSHSVEGKDREGTGHEFADCPLDVPWLDPRLCHFRLQAAAIRVSKARAAAMAWVAGGGCAP